MDGGWEGSGRWVSGRILLYKRGQYHRSLQQLCVQTRHGSSFLEPISILSYGGLPDGPTGHMPKDMLHIAAQHSGDFWATLAFGLELLCRSWNAKRGHGSRQDVPALLACSWRPVRYHILTCILRIRQLDNIIQLAHLCAAILPQALHPVENT